MLLHDSRKGRLFNLCGFVIFMGLAICVFTWGLQYKLSLYDPPQSSSHQIPQAKLLSKNEQASETQGPQAFQTKAFAKVSYTVPATTFLILFIVLSVSVMVEASGKRMRLKDNAAHLHRGLFNIFFVRPPPIFA